jgi:hypothetical protein
MYLFEVQTNPEHPDYDGGFAVTDPDEPDGAMTVPGLNDLLEEWALQQQR